jgi:proline racemase/trans-L-3-hydroxyproline dehydratase
VRQPQRPALVSTVDYHTAGEPFRIVTGGVPSLPGSCVAERREHAAAHLDHLRRLLVQEPRGHGGMYGCFVTPPDDQGAELGAVFFHQSGFSTACGHGTIALATWAADAGLVAADAGAFSIDVPSGRAASGSGGTQAGESAPSASATCRRGCTSAASGCRAPPAR